MRKTLRALVVVLSFLVAVVAIGSFVFKLGELRTSGERSSGAEYSILRNALIGLQTKNDLQDQFLRDRLIALYKGSDRLLAAQVLDSSGLAIWRLPSGSSYFALPGDTSVRGGFRVPEWSTVVFTTPLSEGMRLSALYATVRRSEISLAARTPLIIAAIWCFVVVLCFFLLGKKAPEPMLPEKIDTSDAGAMPEAVETELGPAEEPAAGSFQEEIEGEPGLVAEAGPPETEADDEEIDMTGDTIEGPEEIETERPVRPLAEALRANKNFEESLARLEEEIAEWSSRHSEKTPQPPKAPPAQPAPQIPAEPRIRDEEVEEELDELDEIETAPEEEFTEKEGRDLADSRETLQEFEELRAETAAEKPMSAGKQETIEQPGISPATPQEKQDIATLPLPLSLGDSQLEAKLGEELGRGPRTEVSLMLIHCAVSSRNDPAAVALAVTIKDYIGSKDLIFELYKGAFAVVLPSVDLGGALKMSEDLADVLSATLSLYRDIEGEAPVFIGISARSERKVDAFKLYREASTAVHKAYAGGHSRILAFRPKAE